LRADGSTSTTNSPQAPPAYNGVPRPTWNDGRRVDGMSTVPAKIDPPEGVSYDEPVWDVARLFPAQGCWTEQDYLDLDTNQLVEFSDGFIEFLPMPTTPHQRLVLLLVNLLNAFAGAQNLGEALIAGVRVLLWEGKYREPDVVF